MSTCAYQVNFVFNSDNVTQFLAWPCIHAFKNVSVEDPLNVHEGWAKPTSWLSARLLVNSAKLAQHLMSFQSNWRLIMTLTFTMTAESDLLFATRNFTEMAAFPPAGQTEVCIITLPLLKIIKFSFASRTWKLNCYDFQNLSFFQENWEKWV